MKNVHYDKIVAKAANMELVVFYKLPNEEWWQSESESTILPDKDGIEYFLCLPQHKESCLHWLNCGDVQHLDKGSHVDMTSMNDLKSRVGKIWSYECAWMDGDCEIRIKPKKEKRWIGVFKDGSRFKNTEFSYETVDELKAGCWAPFGFDNWQFIEIEVEV